MKSKTEPISYDIVWGSPYIFLELHGERLWSITANVIGQAFLARVFVLATVKSIEHMKHHDVDRMPEIRVAMKKMNKHQNYTFE